MKALFGRSQRNYPDHHNPDFSHPYYPNKGAQESNISQMPEVSLRDDNYSTDRVPAHRQQNAPIDRARSTLDALQIIRRRFEESQHQQVEDQAAA